MDSEAAVDRGRREAVPGEHELERGDVPAGGAAGQRPAAEEVPSVAAEGAPRAGVDDAGGGEPCAVLETLDRGGRCGAREAVDRGGVEPARPERHLQCGDSRVAGSRRGRRENESGEDE